MRTQALLLVVGVTAFLAGCSSGSATADPGTPAFLWNAAAQTYHNGDLAKANYNLSELQQSDNVFAPRARIWQVVLAAGMARGYSELADAYEAGAKFNRDNSLPFHKQVTDLRAQANHAAMDFTQAVHSFAAQDPSADVQLSFELPPGSAVEPPSLRKVFAGIILPDAEAQALETAMVERGVIRVLCLANGVGEDSAQVLVKYKANEVKTSRATFLYAAAKTLFEASDIFASNRLDQPQRRKVMCDEALVALSSVPETKDSVLLVTRIQNVLRKIPGA
jgi:hypothetical protein